MSEHRVSMLGSSFRRLEDPTRSRDARVQLLISRLHTVEIAPGPHPDFRAELRAQLVAVAPRIVAEGMTDGAAMVDIVPRPTPAQLRAQTTSPARARLSSVRTSDDARSDADADKPVARHRFGRPLLIAASVISALSLLLGGATYMSQSAKPGDALYGLKRAGESFQLATDSTDTERAQDHLAFAAERVRESRALLSVPSAAGAAAVSNSTAELISAALRDADADTRAASRLLGDQALQQSSAVPLTDMTAWAPQQIARLTDLMAAMPAGSLRASAAGSLTLVNNAVNRADSLKSKVACRCTTNFDSLGPVPCVRCTAAATPTPSAPATNAVPTPTTPGSSVVQSPPDTAGAPVSVPNRPSLGGTRGVAPTPTLPRPGLPLPSVPLPTTAPTPPLSVNTCGVDLLGLKVTLCPSGSS